ncbi:Bax inhibitor-1/YccA family protein [Deinococcus yavapaiensis]|uniref:Modulator of FtsH protease n=1 Tax=Deinococcus yavapaiensis KR-236 TaxID=694435 RepID=A0A318S7D8_9DEIO|nr:Bax inhibitor-1/YccA family protein [Deinococcus yavapaiensis]PYE52959.1 hypothetical protein DES52_111131 [Deinococcus yavapaiensis KR-236]
MYPNTIATSSVSTVRSFFNRTYSWMTMGLALTAGIAYLTSTNENLLGFVAENFLMLMLLQLGVVFGLSFLINRVSAGVASGLFVLYAALTGLTFSILPAIYPAADILAAFVTTAGMFGAMSLLGYTTKIDLTRFRGILLMALIGLVIASLVNIFLASGPLSWIISIVGVILFAALTAYDTQKLKELALSGVDASSATGEKLAVYGALTLYLDFINMFMFILRLFGLARSSD